MIVTRPNDARTGITTSRHPRRLANRRDARRVAQLAHGAPDESRRHDPVWLAGGLLLVVVSALGGALLFTALDERDGVLVAAYDLAPGVPVNRESFEVAQVAADSKVSSVPPDLLDAIIGRVPAGPIPKGTVISDPLFVSDLPVGADESIVGVALDPGETPTPVLEIGATVDLVVVSGPPLAVAEGTADRTAKAIGRGVVWAVQSLDSGQLLVSLRADNAVVLGATAASVDDRLRLVLVGRSG